MQILHLSENLRATEKSVKVTLLASFWANGDGCRKLCKTSLQRRGKSSWCKWVWILEGPRSESCKTGYFRERRFVPLALALKLRNLLSIHSLFFTEISSRRNKIIDFDKGIKTLWPFWFYESGNMCLLHNYAAWPGLYNFIVSALTHAGAEKERAFAWRRQLTVWHIFEEKRRDGTHFKPLFKLNLSVRLMVGDCCRPNVGSRPKSWVSSLKLQ